MMKRIFLTFVWCLNILYSFAQSCDIALTPIVTQSSDGSYYPQVESYLINRLQNLTIDNGSISTIENDQFAIAFTYNILDKQIIDGVPTKIVYNLNVSLFIIDLKNKKLYSSFNTELKGVGNNETKALINCFKAISLKNTQIKDFIENGKKKMLDYYDNNYQKIIAKAKADATMKNFDAAIYSLLCIPECSKGFEIALLHLPTIYQQFINQHCNENLAQARAAWYSSPNNDGASIAGVYLSEIYPDATCYNDALELFKEIKKQMGEEWKFMMKQYSDAIAIERQQIEMMREIAIVYAKNQPKNTVNIFWE